MESGRTWIIKVRMSHPQPVKEDLGSKVFTSEKFTDNDIEELRRRLREPPRQLHSAVVERNGDLVASFVASTEPLSEEEERQKLWLLTNAALPPSRSPTKFVIETIYPPAPAPKTE